MKTHIIALATTLLAGTALAQTSPGTPGNTAPGATSVRPMPGVSSSTGTTPDTGLAGRNTGTAAASGDRNQAVTTTGANAPEPAKGSNSFTEGEARRRITARGYTNVTGLKKDADGVWRGTATKDAGSTPVWLDYKGNVGPQGGARPVAGTAPGAGDVSPGATAPGAIPATRNLDGTTGNPPGTAAGRAMDRTLGTNTTGTNPAGTTR